VADLSSKLDVPIDQSMFVQSHTPFADMDHLKNKTVMVVGGDGDKCRTVAEAYGYDRALNHISLHPILTQRADSNPSSHLVTFSSPIPMSGPSPSSFFHTTRTSHAHYQRLSILPRRQHRFALMPSLFTTIPGTGV
jgi:hypothetical protein